MNLSEVKKPLEYVINKQDKIVNALFKTEYELLKDSYSDEVLYAFKLFWDIATRKQKRVRSTFVFQASKLLNFDDEELVLDLGSIIEIVHAYLLVIDDFMDKSMYRRHKLSAHEDLYKKYSLDSYHLANSLAINVGLMGNHFAHKIFSRLNIPHPVKDEILEHISNSYLITGFGQFQDVFNTVSEDITTDKILYTLKSKTGVYTYENPIITGAMLAGAQKGDLEVLSRYAIPAGISFQIIDDILGVFGESERTGKSNMDDLMEGKITLLVAYALEHGSADQKEILKSALGNRKLTEELYEKTKKVLVDTGALEYSRVKAEELAEEAMGYLDSYEGASEWNEEAFSWFKKLPYYILSRDH